MGHDGTCYCVVYVVSSAVCAICTIYAIYCLAILVGRVNILHHTNWYRRKRQLSGWQVLPPVQNRRSKHQIELEFRTIIPGLFSFYYSITHWNVRVGGLFFGYIWKWIWKDWRLLMNILEFSPSRLLSTNGRDKFLKDFHFGLWPRNHLSMDIQWYQTDYMHVSSMTVKCSVYSGLSLW